MREGGRVTPLTRSAVISLPNRAFFFLVLLFFLLFFFEEAGDCKGELKQPVFIIYMLHELPNSNERQDCLGN